MRTTQFSRSEIETQKRIIMTGIVIMGAFLLALLVVVSCIRS